MAIGIYIDLRLTHNGVVSGLAPREASSLTTKEPLLFSKEI